jgi:hypothetical protein
VQRKQRYGHVQAEFPCLARHEDQQGRYDLNITGAFPEDDDSFINRYVCFDELWTGGPLKPGFGLSGDVRRSQAGRIRLYATSTTCLPRFSIAVFGNSCP